MQKLIFSLICLILLNFPTFPQSNDDYRYSKCWEYSTPSYNHKTIASDNLNKLIVFGSDNGVIAITTAGKFFWKSEILNEEIREIVIRDSSAFIYSENTTSWFLREMSILTGLTKRILEQTKPNDKTDFSQMKVLNDEIAIISSDGGAIFIKEQNGNLEQFVKPAYDYSSPKVWSRSSVSYFDLTKKIIVALDKSTTTNSLKLDKGFLVNDFHNLDGDYVFTSVDGKMIVFDAKSLKKKWMFQTGAGIVHLDKINQSYVVFSNDNYVYQISSKNGQIRWKFKGLSRATGIVDRLMSRTYLVNLNEKSASVLSSSGKSVFQLLLNDPNYFIAKPSMISNQILFPTSFGILSLSEKGC